MDVSISRAADMVGITRATLYRHIEKKGISVHKDDEDNPKINVSELIRVYGDRVRMPEAPSGNDNHHDTPRGQSSQHTPKQNYTATTELEVLRERVKHLETQISASQSEREREREQLSHQIEMLQDRLVHAEDHQKRLTLLLTDQSDRAKGAQGRTAQAAAQTAQKLKSMEVAMQRLQQHNKHLTAEVTRQKNTPLWQKILKGQGGVNADLDGRNR